MTSLLDLQEAWQKHPRFKNRALGGRRALDGFYYQLAVSLDRFFDAVLRQREEDVEIAFEGLSDLSESRNGLTYLIQIKTTLARKSLLDALAEALAIDEFLEECFPALRQHFRFKITTRRLHRDVPTKPTTLGAADLALDAVAAERWESLRARCLPVQVASAPEIRLATRLWSDVTRPFALIDSCMGRLLDLLTSGASPLDITKALINLWQAARHEEKAPLYLLGAADLECVPASGHRIVHGVRPAIGDLREGCFMERPERLEAALSVVRERWAADSKDRRRVIPVFWITGPSGAGKSVLLLQLARELVAEGSVEAVNYVDTYAHVLPRALAAAGTSIPVIIAGDDLYSPENRDPVIWREVGERGATEIFPGRFAILTCGPPEHLKAFKNECERHRALEPVEIRIEPLDTDERAAYHTWYQERTGAKVPLTKEAIFIAAAWTYELYREEQLTPEAFAKRFDQRLGELELALAGHAALALNLYGLKAPEALFAEHKGNLAQLISEQIWRLANPGTGVLAGRFFHPQISRLIYDALVPRGESVRRAEDIARGFDAMLEEGAPADAFLGWLGSGKIGKSRARGALLLDEHMRVEILLALWPHFRRRGPTEDVIARLMRWHKIAIGAGIDLQALGVKERTRSWWRGADEQAHIWGYLFQMVWDAANGTERSVLLGRGKTWLQTHFDVGSWSWIYPRLIKFAHADGDLRAFGLRWLAEHPTHGGWPGVWGGLYETHDDSYTPQNGESVELLRLAIQAIPVQPESDADLAVWERTAKLNRKRYERTLLPESGSVPEIARGLTGHGGYDGGRCQASSQA